MAAAFRTFAVEGPLARKLSTLAKKRISKLVSCRVTALAESEPDFVVMRLARHRNISTTKRYIELVDQAKRAGVDALAGRPSVAGLDLVQDLGRPPSPRQKSPTEKPRGQKKRLSA